MSARLLGLGFGCDMGTPCRKLILLKLIDACEDDGSRIFPAVATIARAAQCSARQVQRELALFVEVGLLTIVHEGGMGPGSTREYQMNVAMLRAIEAEGWSAVTAGVETSKGDTVSPLEGDKGDTVSPLQGDKGDTGDTVRVTPATDKGDIACHPTPYYPSSYPSTARAGARERENNPEDRKKIEAAYWRMIRVWPQLTALPKDRGLKAFMALSPEDRQIAERRFPAWLAMLKARGKVHVHQPSTYFGQRLFDEVPDVPPGPEPVPAVIEAKPFGRAGMARRLALCLAGPTFTRLRLTLIEQRLVDAGEARADVLLRDKRAMQGFPNVTGESGHDRRRAVSVPADIAVLGDGFVQARRGDAHFEAWAEAHRQRGWPFVPAWVEWTWLPDGAPDEALTRMAASLGLDTARRCEGRAGDGREAAE